MDIKQEAEKLIKELDDGIEVSANTGIEVIENLLKELEAKVNIINDLRKQNSRGEINEAYAAQIERDAEEIRQLKVKNNKLGQRVESVRGKLEATERKLAEDEFSLRIAIKAIKQIDQVNDNPSTYSDTINSIINAATGIIHDTLSGYEVSKEIEMNLEEGWYWLSNSNEGDLFYPVYVNAHGDYVYDGKHFPVEDLKQVDYVKAVMPDSKLEQENQRLRKIIDKHNKIYGGTYCEAGTE